MKKVVFPQKIFLNTKRNIEFSLQLEANLLSHNSNEHICTQKMAKGQLWFVKNVSGLQKNCFICWKDFFPFCHGFYFLVTDVAYRENQKLFFYC